MYHCTRCRKQFKFTVESDGIDVCPLCSSDMDLEDGPLPECLKPKPAEIKKRKEFNMEQWKKKKEELDAFEERRLLHYHEVYKREGQRSAEWAYLNYTEENL